MRCESRRYVLVDVLRRDGGRTSPVSGIVARMSLPLPAIRRWCVPLVAAAALGCAPDPGSSDGGSTGTSSGSGSDSVANGDGSGTCAQGNEGCPCYGNSTCNDGLECATTGVCVSSSCSDGDADCPCYGNATCNDGLICGNDGRCHPEGGATSTTTGGNDTTGDPGDSTTEGSDSGGGDPGCGNVPDDMVCVPAATFEMGTDLMTLDGDPVQPYENPAHEITISSSFWIDLTEVTAGDYAMCWGAGVCSIPVAGGDHTWAVAGEEDHPINGVTWYQASDYCTWAGKRLPTEAEWELAARGTDGRMYPWGDDPTTCAHVVSNGCGTSGTQPVGSKPDGDSPYGIHDMAGNVSEWVADYYQADYYYVSPAVDPQGPAMGMSRSLRSLTNFVYPPSGAHRATARTGASPLLDDINTTVVGFRCAQTPS